MRLLPGLAHPVKSRPFDPFLAALPDFLFPHRRMFHAWYGGHVQAARPAPVLRLYSSEQRLIPVHRS